MENKMKLIKIQALMKADGEQELEALGIKPNYEDRHFDDLWFNPANITTVTRTDPDIYEGEWTSVNLGYDGFVTNMTPKEFLKFIENQ